MSESIIKIYGFDNQYKSKLADAIKKEFDVPQKIGLGVYSPLGNILTIIINDPKDIKKMLDFLIDEDIHKKYTAQGISFVTDDILNTKEYNELLKTLEK